MLLFWDWSSINLIQLHSVEQILYRMDPQILLGLKLENKLVYI